MWDIAAAFFASASIIIIIWESESFYDNDNTSTF